MYKRVAPVGSKAVEFGTHMSVQTTGHMVEEAADSSCSHKDGDSCWVFVDVMSVFGVVSAYGHVANSVLGECG